MNPEVIGQMIRLRYKLMWAKTRSRNGKIALFLIGYLLLILVVVLLSAGGFGAGMAAVRMGKAELVAQIVLGSLFVQATLSTVLLGFGLSAVFSETELRRYPMTALERRLARHITAIVDPFWFLVLALDLGLAVGLYAMGAAGFWAGIGGVLLLLVANYLLARLVALSVDRLIRRKGGSMLLLAAIIGLSMIPGGLATALTKDPALGERIVGWLSWTPPFGAAAAMTGNGPAVLSGLAVILWWILGLALAVVWLERRPAERQQAAVAGPISWRSPYARVAGWFGAEQAPLVEHWLRYYVRNTRFRATYVLTLPLAGFLAFQMGTQGRHPAGIFVGALGAIPMCGVLCTSRFAVNLFGYTGGAFRRLFLLPIAPAACLRAASYASLMLGSTLLLLAVVAWVALAPVPWGAGTLAMLIFMGVAGMFGLNAAGLWTTLYNPRRGNYNASLGNDMSAAGNIIVIGIILVPLMGVRILAREDPGLIAPGNWWMAGVLAALAVAFYYVSLSVVAPRFSARRERLMAVVEGRA